MISRIQVLSLVVLSLAVSSGVLLVRGEPVSAAWLLVIGATSGAVFAICQVFNNTLWRFSFLQGWFVHRPHIYGEWAVEISSLYEKDGERIPVKHATATVSQTYADIHMSLSSDESSGELLHGKILQQSNNEFRFTGVYLNTPKLERQRTGSNAHRGTFWLTVSGHPNQPNEMRGPYWTDRETSGEMIFKRINKG